MARKAIPGRIYIASWSNTNYVSRQPEPVQSYMQQGHMSEDRFSFWGWATILTFAVHVGYPSCTSYDMYQNRSRVSNHQGIFPIDVDFTELQASSQNVRTQLSPVVLRSSNFCVPLTYSYWWCKLTNVCGRGLVQYTHDIKLFESALYSRLEM